MKTPIVASELQGFFMQIENVKLMKEKYYE